jgi:hypothetical protein
MMQKWEYCTLGPIEFSSASWKWLPNEPTRIIFTRKGMVEEGFKIDETSSLKDVQNDVAKVLARLGDEGWEMVGCGAVFASGHFLYFKRPFD